MSSYQVSRLAGMRDLSGSAYQRLAGSAQSFQAYMAGSGYDVIDTPLLEETELFVRKSGGELTSRLYSFVDPGGHRISLRPEFTPSVIRHFVQHGGSREVPIRWQYSGPVFRYELEDVGSSRQFTQVGAELIGSNGVEADSEVLSLAWGCLREMGLTNHKVRIGHLGVIYALLENFGLSERAKRFVISNVHGMRNGDTDIRALTQQAHDVGVLGPVLERVGEDAATPVERESTREFMQSALDGAMPATVGRRSSAQIVERLMRKVRETDSPESLEGALALIRDLSHVAGSPSTALEHAQSVAKAHGAQTSAFAELIELFASLDDRGIAEAHLELDLGLVRGIAYYTGVTFEFVYPGSPDGPLLGGGGRYDGLVKALGGDDVPALGFAYTLERLVEALDKESSRTPRSAKVISVAEESRASTGGP